MNKNVFGMTKDNQEVYQYVFENNFLSLSVLNYGGIIQELQAQDHFGDFANIILGYDDLESYEELSPDFGAIIDCSIQNSEHGRKLHKKIWKEISFKDNKLELFYKSSNNEINDIEFILTYELQENRLIWTMTGVPDKATPINITNHSYFNLSSSKNLATNHFMQINANEFFPVDEQGISLKQSIPVKKTAFDFLIAKKISQNIDDNDPQLHIKQGYDHAFLLNGKQAAITCFDFYSRRELKMYTNQPICVFYSGNLLSEKNGTLNSHQICKKRLGICFETQALPNIITPEKPYFQETIWEFSINHNFDI